MSSVFYLKSDIRPEMAAMLQRRGEIRLCWLLICWWSLSADLEMALFSSPWTLFLYIWHIFLTWSLTFLAPVFWTTPALKNLIASVRSYLRRSSSRNHEKIAASGSAIATAVGWPVPMPIGPGRYQFPRFSIGPHRSVFRFRPRRPFFPFFLVLVGARGRERWLFIFYGSLYQLQRIFY